MDPRPHALYRFYDADDTLLYVGITHDPGTRWRDHQNTKFWWGDIRRISLDHYANREAALLAERLAIEAEHPRHNIQHNRGPRPPVEVDEMTAWAVWGTIADHMPDDCHDVCVKAGIYATYYPYRWTSDGRARYQCANGHRWTCWWGHNHSGEAPAWRGRPAWGGPA